MFLQSHIEERVCTNAGSASTLKIGSYIFKMYRTLKTLRLSWKKKQKTAPNPTRQARSWRVVTVVSLLLKDIKVQSLHWLTSVSTNINLQSTSLRQPCCPRLSCIASPTSFCFSLLRPFPWANDLFRELIATDTDLYLRSTTSSYLSDRTGGERIKVPPTGFICF